MQLIEICVLVFTFVMKKKRIMHMVQKLIIIISNLMDLSIHIGWMTF